MSVEWLKFPLNEDDGDARFVRCGVLELPGGADGLTRCVDAPQQQPGIAWQRIQMHDTVGVPSDPGDLPPDERVHPLSDVAGKCETQRNLCRMLA